MNKKLKEFGNDILGFTKKNSPAILTGLAVVGSITTAVSAYKAGIRAADVIEEHQKQMKYVRKGDKEAKNAVMKDTAKSLVPILAPPIIIGVTTTACILGSNYISSKRVAVLSVAYAAAERSVKDWQHKTEELLGEKKTRQIKDAIIQDKVKEHKSSEPEKVPIIGSGRTRCFDTFSGREWWGDPEKIKQAIVKLSADCQSDMYVSMNDFYIEIGLKPTPMGSDFGWNIDDLIRGMLPITHTAVLNDIDEPCFAIDYNVMPRNDYRNLH